MGTEDRPDVNEEEMVDSPCTKKGKKVICLSPLGDWQVHDQPWMVRPPPPHKMPEDPMMFDDVI